MRIIIKYLHEPEKGGEAFNLEALSKSVVLSGVYLAEVHRWVLLLEDSSCGSIFRGQLLAVTAKIKVSLLCLRRGIPMRQHAFA
jgi:hypothetical protein